MDKFQYSKMHENAYNLERANPSDAGMDIRYGPEDGESEIIRPAENKVLETGLKFQIPHGYMVEIMNRSSVATDGLVVGAHVIDSGYEGEVLINMHWVSEYEHWVSHETSRAAPHKIKPGDKIAQAVLKPISTAEPTEIDESELYEDVEVHSDRGEGGFGSTGDR